MRIIHGKGTGRLRDAVRGGNPFDDVRLQGFVTGLILTNNASEKRNAEDQQILLNNYTDWIRLGLAGNLASYELIRADGNNVPGRLISYNGSPAGYTDDPQENIIYVSAHDNQTLFDAVQAKAPAEATIADRVRMNNLAVSIVMFSQGVPFFHAGDDILRSKSFNPNSYNSGDWYNKLDWTYESNNWGAGLPIEGTGQWDIYKPLLADPNLAPAKTDITFASAVFREFLQIRKSSPLFRLQTEAQVKQSLSFLNNGPQATPGLIVMRLTDTNGIDPNYQELVVLFNARPEAVTFSDAALSGNYTLHAIQQNSADDAVKSAAYENGAFNVPARTTAVFVIEKAKPAPETPTESAPAETPTPTPNNTLTLVGVIAALLALLGLGVFLRRKKA